MKSRIGLKRCAGAALIMAVVGCGGGPAPETRPPELELTQRTPPPGPAPDFDEPDANEGGAGEGGAKAAPEPAPAPAPPPQRSGRPAILMGPTKEISSSFGVSPGAVLKLKGDGGTITFKLPELALPAPYNITWKINSGSKVRPKSRLIGSMAQLTMLPATKTVPRAVDTVGEKFELRWPLNKQPSLNLAIGTVDVGSDGALGKVSWQVVAPSRVEAGFGEAYFHLTTVGPIMYLHGTTSDVSAAE